MKTRLFKAVVLAASSCAFAAPALGEVLYEQNFDSLASLEPPAGFQAQAPLEREPGDIAIGTYAMNSSGYQFFKAQTDVYTIEFLMAVTEEYAPDNLGAQLQLRGRATGSEQPGVQIRWGQTEAGRPAYYDGFAWVTVGDLDFDGMESGDETWPAPMPLSTPGDPQWVPIRLVVEPETGLYEYWQGDANDLDFETMVQYESELFMPVIQPVMTSYVFTLPADGGVYIDQMRIYNDAETVLEDGFEEVPERVDDVIAVDGQSLALLQNIDNGIAEYDPIEENFTVQFLMAVTVPGEQNLRAAQLLINGTGGIGPQLAWGNMEPGRANYYDGSAWRYVGDTDLDGTENGDETWPPPLAVTDPGDPGTQQWIPFRFDVKLDSGTFDYYQGEPNDLSFATLTPYAADVPMRNPLLASDSVNFQNAQRGGGVFYVDNFSLTTESGIAVIDEDFEGDWETPEPPVNGGALEQAIAVGRQSLRVRAGEDNVSFGFEPQEVPVYIDFLLATGVEGESGARAARIHVRGEGTIGGQVAWGELAPGQPSYYDGSQWVLIGDSDKNNAEDGGEAFAPPIPVSGASENWTAIRIVADPETDAFEYWQGAPGDESFDSLTRVEPDPTFRNPVNSINEILFPFGDRAGGDFFLDNIAIYTLEDTAVAEWELY